MEEIIEMFKNEERVILFGDWNVQSFSEFDTLINAGYKSINGRYAPLQRSYNSEQNYTKTADKTKDKYFDNILIKGSFVGTLKVHEVYDQLLSDHLPVSAEITMK
jgi:endonuclease/exonuclease/phosphatase family metal-dependent hydrolase